MDSFLFIGKFIKYIFNDQLLFFLSHLEELKNELNECERVSIFLEIILSPGDDPDIK